MPNRALWVALPMIACVVCVVLAAGCGTSGPGVASGKASNVKPLTEDQKVAWKRMRNKYGPCYHVAVLTKDGWMLYDAFEQEYSPSIPRLKENAFGSITSAETKAMESVRSPRFKSVAIVDLFSEQTPKAARWFSDDGTTVKKYDQPPTPDLDKSLKEYFLFLQASSMD